MKLKKWLLWIVTFLIISLLFFVWKVEILDKQASDKAVYPRQAWKSIDIGKVIDDSGYGPLNLATIAAFATNVYFPFGDEDKTCLGDTGRIPISGWHFERNDWSGDSPGQNLSGYYAEVWTHIESHEPPLVVIAFRGSNFNEIPDWCTNLGLTWLPLVCGAESQYTQAATRVWQLIELLNEDLDPNTNYVVVGHSLGGGLAQLAGHVSAKVNRVYSFDSSPVIGLAKIDPSMVDLEGYPSIVSIYEHGEVLQVPRRLNYMLFDQSSYLSSIEEIRFNLLEGDAITQHNMKKFACELKMHSIQE